MTPLHRSYVFTAIVAGCLLIVIAVQSQFAQWPMDGLSKSVCADLAYAEACLQGRANLIAIWTAVMGTLVGLVSAALVLQSLRASREAQEHATKIAALEYACKIKVKIVDVILDEKGRLTFNIEVQNYGRTAAFRVSQKVTAAAQFYTVFSDQPDEQKFSIASLLGDIHPSDAPVVQNMPAMFLPSEVAKDIESGVRALNVKFEMQCVDTFVKIQRFRDVRLFTIGWLGKLIPDG